MIAVVLVGYVVLRPLARCGPRRGPPARDGAGDLVGRRACSSCSPARSTPGRRRPGRDLRRDRPPRPVPVRLVPVRRSCSACCARASSAPAPSRSCCSRLGEAPGPGPARPAGRRARRPLARRSSTGSTAEASGSTPTASRPRCRPRRRRGPWTPVEREGRARGRDRARRTLCDGPRAARLGRRRRRPRDGERAPAGQLRARVEELRASRARIVEAGTPERRRLERNLHDGAQQRLVALSLTLRLAQSQLRQGPRRGGRAARRRPGGAHAGARASCASSHAASTPRSCPTAASGRRSRRSPGARRSPSSWPRCPRSRCRSRSRRPPTSWSPRRSPTSSSTPTPARRRCASRARNGHAVVEVADDGIGGADPGRGSGLRGLADRVSALDGSMELDSPAGAGTRLRAEIPV